MTHMLSMFEKNLQFDHNSASICLLSSFIFHLVLVANYC
jgi:hypothetical protein